MTDRGEVDGKAATLSDSQTYGGTTDRMSVAHVESEGDVKSMMYAISHMMTVTQRERLVPKHLQQANDMVKHLLHTYPCNVTRQNSAYPITTHY